MDVDREAAAGHNGEALIRIAGEAGHQITTRMLETYRAQGLLPKPARTGHRGRRPIWTYPDHAARQLVALLRWHQHTKDRHTLCVLLWVDGFPITLDTVRAALIDSIAANLDMLNREITAYAQRHGLDPTVEGDRDRALGQMAAELSAKRGPDSIPRRTRVRAADRALSLHLLLSAFALGDVAAVTGEDSETVERVLGVAPNGRHQRIDDAGPWLTGPAEALFEAAQVASLPAALQAVHEASESELTTARDIVAVWFRCLPLLARMVKALFDNPNHAGLASLDQFGQHPESVMFLVPTVLGFLRAGWQDNLQAFTRALDPMPDLAAEARNLVDQPQSAITANLSQQPPEVRRRAQRIINAAINGEFDQKGRR